LDVKIRKVIGVTERYCLNRNWYRKTNFIPTHVR